MADLDPYERWMLRQNLSRIASGKATVPDTIALLQDLAESA